MAYQKLQKGFDYALQVGNTPLFFVQEVTFPEIGVEEVEHGGYGTAQKTAGRQTTGDLELKMLMLADLNGQAGALADELRLQPKRASQLLGGATGTAGITGFSFTFLDDTALSSIIWDTLVLVQYGGIPQTGGVAPIVRKWEFKGCFVKTYTIENLSRTSSENAIQSVTFAVNAVRRII